MIESRTTTRCGADQTTDGTDNLLAPEWQCVMSKCSSLYKRHRFLPTIIQHVVPHGQASRSGSVIASIRATAISRILWLSAVPGSAMSRFGSGVSSSARSMPSDFGQTLSSISTTCLCVMELRGGEVSRANTENCTSREVNLSVPIGVSKQVDPHNRILIWLGRFISPMSCSCRGRGIDSVQE